MAYVKQGVLTILLAIIGAGSVMAVEEAKYTVVLEEQNFEVRAYAAHIVAETIVDGGFDKAGNKAFRRLFKYITGDNQSRQKIAMTAPVAQGADSEKIDMTSPVGQREAGGSWAVSFTMPASYLLETLPEPKDPQVSLRQVPARQMAAVRYSGFWSEKNYIHNRNKLEDWIVEKGLNAVGEPIWARYDPPFMPWFLRRNEILVPIANPPIKSE